MPVHPYNSLKWQRGAIGVMGILLLLLAVLFVALAIDTGRLMMVQRQLQTVADMAALDASSQSGYCGTQDSDAITLLAENSAVRNNHLTSASDTLNVDLGTTSVNAAGVRTFTITPAAQSNAVQVTASKTVPSSLVAGGILGGQTTLSAQAVAQRQAEAGFSAGSGLVSLDLEDSSLLNQLWSQILGSTLDLDLLSYQGLAAADISLMDIIEATPSVGTVEELLAANLSVTELLQIYADALNASSTANATATAALQTIISASPTLPDLVSVSDILNISSADSVKALDTSVNLFDMVMTTLLAANGVNAIDLTTPVTLPGDTLSVVTELSVIEAPKIAVGPPGRNAAGEWQTAIQTAQIRLKVSIEANVNLLVAAANVAMALNVEVAQGEAWLQSIECRRVASPSTWVTIGAQPGIAAVTLTDVDDTSLPAQAIGVSLLGIPIANVPIALNVPLQPPTANELEYEVSASNPLPQMQTTSANVSASLQNGLSGIDSELELGPIEVLSLSLVDQLLLGAVYNLVLNDLVNTLLDQLLSPLLTQVSTTVIDPLLSLLGIQLGTMDVTLFRLQQERPQLER